MQYVGRKGSQVNISESGISFNNATRGEVIVILREAHWKLQGQTSTTQQMQGWPRVQQ